MRMRVFYVIACLLLADLSFQKETRVYERAKVTIGDDTNVNVTVQGNSAQFFVIGDWGGLPVFPFRTVVEQNVANEMSKMASLYNTQFQLALGDNFYFDGVKDVTDKRFDETFEKVFEGSKLQNPWFVLMGNHDHYGNASAQIEYTKKSNRWILPDYDYTITVKTNDGKDLIKILMIDTVLYCGNSGYDVENRQPMFVSAEHRRLGNAYADSIAKKIKEIGSTSVPYFIVAGHFPVWSVAEHGPTDCLLKTLRPLLHQNKVNAYMCGHDHNLQHISDTFNDQTVEYIVSGSANFVQNSTAHLTDIPKDSLKFRWAGSVEQLHGGYVLIQANAENMIFTHVESTGKSLYQRIIKPRQL